MWVKIREIGKALHPNEVVVEVKTASRSERLVVDRRSIENQSLYIGHPVGQKGRNYLVELPRETMSGSWRVWVNEGQLLPDMEAAGAA